MTILKNNISPFLTKEHRNHWRILLPFIAPEHTASDIEQILETKKGNEGFKLEVNLMPQNPEGVEDYQNHENSVRQLFERIFERRYTISLLTVSGIDHDAIVNNRESDYEFLKPDDFVKWNYFIKNTITISHSQFYSHHLTFKGRRLAKNVSLVMEEDYFNELYEDVSGTNFEYENTTKGTHEKEISAWSLKIPLGSIIHMTLTPR